ncbi:hypothetical protein [Paraferrimonas haliotis]|uniref:Uncharacterized protein n=1 Tax=Paraferrimonas haliotis TaxID=2013866 RepID=A0AA37X0X1_9GAMM|nr:hypothetical protein [Paraferrimonas haliotis]GLS84996.1 hypothetical protein GCM10007894_29730 [Paraferrimonas haliotis]
METMDNSLVPYLQKWPVIAALLLLAFSNQVRATLGPAPVNNPNHTDEFFEMCESARVPPHNDCLQYYDYHVEALTYGGETKNQVRLFTTTKNFGTGVIIVRFEMDYLTTGINTANENSPSSINIAIDKTVRDVTQAMLDGSMVSTASNLPQTPVALSAFGVADRLRDFLDDVGRLKNAHDFMKLFNFTADKSIQSLIIIPCPKLDCFILLYNGVNIDGEPMVTILTTVSEFNPVVEIITQSAEVRESIEDSHFNLFMRGNTDWICTSRVRSEVIPCENKKIQKCYKVTLTWTCYEQE